MKKLIIALIIFFAEFNQTIAEPIDKPITSKQAINSGFADVVEDLLPAVVNISTTPKPKEDVAQILNKLPEDKVFEQLKDALQKENLKQKKLSSLGSGFIISKDGYVVTKYHVVENASQITVSLNDGTSFIAKVIGVDKKTDNALLKIDAPNPLKYVKFGESNKSRIGDWVIVIGNPFGLGGSVSVGIVSARGRDLIAGQGDFIQTDAAINRGNSGGPVFNTNGEVIGIASAIFSTSGGSIGIGFAGTSETLVPIIQQLKEHGEVVRGWIGVSTQEVSEEIAKAVGLTKPRGALINNVTKNGPAWRAGVLPSDIIVKFDDINIDEVKTLSAAVSQTKVGRKVQIIVLRGEKLITLNATVAQMPEESEESKAIFKPKTQATILGLDLTDLNWEIQKQYALNKEIKGVLVLSVNSSGRAAEAGIMAGDIILKVNQAPVESVKSLQNNILKAISENKEAVLFLIKRQEQQLNLAVNLNSDPLKK